jgi:hypothetical protein
MASELSVRTEFHTHHASPRRLFKELEVLLGPTARFTVDVSYSKFFYMRLLTKLSPDAA